MNQREDQTLIAPQKVAHFPGVFGSRCFVFADGVRIEKVAINLTVEVFAVGDDNKRIVARIFMEHLAGKEDHRKTFSRSLRMPENAKLAVLVFACFKRRNRLVHTDELMVLRYNLVGVSMIQNKIFDIVQKARFR